MVDTTKHEGLSAVEGFPFPVLNSSGFEEAATSIARRCASSYELFSRTFECRPEVALLVLNPEDWKSRAEVPVYGLPHYFDGNLIVAGQSSDFWRAFADILHAASPDALQEAMRVYGEDLDLGRYFDLIAVHELAHAFHMQIPFKFPRLWLMELFANLCLHTYVAEREPESLPYLETLPRLALLHDRTTYPHRSLDAFEARYSAIEPVNYGWYQFQLEIGTKKLYDAAGSAAMERMWRTFVISDDRLAEILDRGVHPEAARLMTGWPRSSDPGCQA